MFTKFPLIYLPTTLIDNIRGSLTAHNMILILTYDVVRVMHSKLGTILQSDPKGSYSAVTLDILFLVSRQRESETRRKLRLTCQHCNLMHPGGTSQQITSRLITTALQEGVSLFQSFATRMAELLRAMLRITVLLLALGCVAAKRLVKLVFLQRLGLCFCLDLFWIH